MALFLCIETSTKNCSVSITNNEQLLSLNEYCHEQYSHGEKLHVLIQSSLSELNIDISKIDAFCFSSGPGSYTGLRIGASSLKGFSYVLDKPLISVSTLESMAYGIIDEILIKNSLKFDILCPVLDSRQGEVYLAMYDFHLNEIVSPCACVVDKFPFSNFINRKILFFGPDLQKINHLRQNKKIEFYADFYPSAKYLAKPCLKAFNNSIFEDIAYFEPSYLKPFVPTKSK